MKHSLNTKNNPATDKQDGIVVAVFTQDDKEKTPILGSAGEQLDKAQNGLISTILKQGDFKAHAEKTLLIPTPEGSRIILMGCGKKDELDSKTLSRCVKAVGKTIKDTSIKKLSFYLPEAPLTPLDGKAQAIIQTVIAFADSLYSLTDYKSKDKEVPPLTELTLSSVDGFDNRHQNDLDKGIGIATGMKLARDLANRPGNVCTPGFLAETAVSLGADYKNIDVDVLEESDMEKLGMGSFLSVSKGSDEPGKMIVLQYLGAKNKNDAPVALVGKGVTFDSGGISLKPGAKMDEMKFDMSGAAGMLGTLKACAEMKLPINLVVVLAAAENMPSARASKPGDIVTSLQGTTIEVLNTDAEGRLVLCDALTYVAKYKPAVVIDAATLTGACIVALGHHICAVLSNNDELAEELQTAGESINDQTWRLPMNDDYKKQLKSEFADLGNIGGPAAGTITAACFLGEFTKDYKWAHLDIAGTAWDGKNATGRPVPLLSQYLINYAQSLA